MSKNYDNWEKLVGAVLKKEKFRQLALSHSVSSSSNGDESSCSSFNSIMTPFGHHSNDDSICKWSLPGKVVFLPAEASEFSIRTEDYPKTAYSFRGNRFDEAAEVKPCLWIDIRVKINTRLLTANTIYGAYLMFLEGRGYEAKAMVKFVNEETDVDAERRATKVQLVNGEKEVALGSFYVDEREEREVEASLVDTNTSKCWKAGIVVEGIQFRPLVNVKHLDSTFN